MKDGRYIRDVYRNVVRMNSGTARSDSQAVSITIAYLGTAFNSTTCSSTGEVHMETGDTCLRREDLDANTVVLVLRDVLYQVERVSVRY